LIQNVIVCLLLSATAALMSNPAQGRIFTGGVCGGSYPHTFITPLLPPDQLTIPTTGLPGDYLGLWYSSFSLGDTFMDYPYFICATWSAAYNNFSGAEDNLYVLGIKPTTVYASPDLASKDGYTIFTTSELEAIGIGFILRWRVHTQVEGIGGAWRSPSDTWSVDVPPTSAGLPFYHFPTHSFVGGYGAWWFNNVGTENLSSLAAFRAKMLATPSYRRGVITSVYGAQVEVRYVLTKPASQIYEWLDSKTRTITTYFVILQARPQSYQINNVYAHQTTTFRLPPLKTCETPSAAEATVNFNMAFASLIPNPGDTTAEKELTFTLRNCGRNNLNYYVHANGKWVNPSQGIVGLSPSTPHADPDIGNPRGFGIQLLHNGGQNGSGPVYVHPSEITPFPTDNAYLLNWQGAGAVNDPTTGVTYTIPLRARVIRTSPANVTIDPGPFKASLVVVFKYQ